MVSRESIQQAADVTSVLPSTHQRFAIASVIVAEMHARHDLQS
jgi:hypothetical protein